MKQYYLENPLLNQWANLYMSLEEADEKKMHELVEEQNMETMSDEDLNDAIEHLQFVIDATKEITSLDKAIGVILESYENELLSICGALHPMKNIIRCKMALNFLKVYRKAK